MPESFPPPPHIKRCLAWPINGQWDIIEYDGKTWRCQGRRIHEGLQKYVELPDESW